MSMEENKAIVRRVNDEVWSKGRLDVIDELIADDFVATVVGAPEQIRGPQGFREFVGMYRKAFPDLRITQPLTSTGGVERVAAPNVRRLGSRYWALG